MSTIDILTTQNVTITYQLASLRERMFAFLLDMLVLVICMSLLLYFFYQLFPSLDSTFYFVFYFAGSSFYTLLSEILMDGTSAGKKVIGLKVMKLEGITPSLNDYLVRWAFRPIEIWLTLGSVASMVISSSTKGQRLGDIIANTTVVKTRPEENLTLKDILSIKTLENYHPVYPQVLQLDEQDMILLKEISDRYLKYKNPAHTEILNSAIENVRAKLDIKEMPKDKVAFIRVLIKDFVALSR